MQYLWWIERRPSDKKTWHPVDNPVTSEKEARRKFDTAVKLQKERKVKRAASVAANTWLSPDDLIDYAYRLCKVPYIVVAAEES